MARRSKLSLIIMTPRKRQRGAVAIIVALSLAVLVGFAGLALDLGKLYVAKTELQNAADACALAAAQSLTVTESDKLNFAEDAGITAGSMNKVMFQAEEVIVDESSVKFSSDINNGFFSKEAASGDIKFVECTVEKSEIRTWFMQALNSNIENQIVRARAVATVIPSQVSCALPIALCTESVDKADIGDWLGGATGPTQAEQDKVVNGAFKWINLDESTGSTQDLQKILSGPGTCYVPAEGKPLGPSNGNKAALAKGWNSRFGIFTNTMTEAGTIRDFSGYAYTEVNWPPPAGKTIPRDAYKGTQSAGSTTGPAINFVDARKNLSIYQGDAYTGLNVEGGSTSVKPKCTSGSNCGDRRLATAPVINCGELKTNGATKPVSWACILMLHPINTNAGKTKTLTGDTRMYVEYLGNASSSSPLSPCVTAGVPGDGDGIGPLVPALVQ